MAPGPPNKQSNRFAILGDYLEQSVKDYPLLSPVKSSALSDPKYLIVSSKNNELQKLSPFIIHKGLHSISTLIDSISQLRDGNLLLLVRNQVIANKFLKAKSLSNICEINVKLHETLNFVKGVIYAPCLINVPEDEIVNELKDQGVVSIYKFTSIREDGTKSFTGHMILTFNLYNLPKTIDVAWYKVRVKTYFPNPMRCRNCQLLGHTQNKCSNPASCDNCNLPPHQPTNCTRLQCANCGEKHPASDKNCPRYLQQKDIIRIKTLEKCSFGVAKRKYELNLNLKSTKNPSYAEISKNNNSMNSVDKQIQKRPATSPKVTNKTDKLPRSQSLSSSSSIEMDVDLISNPSTSTKLQKSDKQDNSSILTKNSKLSPKQMLRSKITPTSKSSDEENINSKKTQSTNSLSPLGKLTQDLIRTDQYFISRSDTQ